MSSEIRLYSYWRSSASWRVRIVLAAKGLAYTIIPINLLAGAQRGEAYSEINSMQQVPTLETGNLKLTQSLAIMNYLEQTHPEPALVPADPIQRAKMIEICELINSGIQPLQNHSILNTIERLGGNQNEWVVEVMKKGFQSLESILTQTAGRFSIGDQLTLADACVLPQVYNAKRRNVDLSPYPVMVKVVSELDSLQLIEAARPEQQPDAVAT